MLPSWDEDDLYNIVGTHRTASPDSIRKAYYRQALQAHPDKGGDHESFRKLRHAFAVLSDEGKRCAYDTTVTADAILRWKSAGGMGSPTAFLPSSFLVSRREAGVLPAAAASPQPQPQRPGCSMPVGEGAEEQPPQHRLDSALQIQEAGAKRPTPSTPILQRQPWAGGHADAHGQRDPGPTESTDDETDTITSDPGIPPPKRARSLEEGELHSLPAPRAHPSRPVDAGVSRYDLHVSLEDLYNGCLKRVRLLETAQGREDVARLHIGPDEEVEVEVPAGCQIGAVLRWPGPRTARRCSNGHSLEFVVCQKPHARYRRRGADLITSVSASVYARRVLRDPGSSAPPLIARCPSWPCRGAGGTCSWAKH